MFVPPSYKMIFPSYHSYSQDSYGGIPDFSCFSEGKPVKNWDWRICSRSGWFPDSDNESILHNPSRSLTHVNDHVLDLPRDHPIDNGSFESSSSDSDRPLILTGGTLTPVSTPASPVSPRPLWDVRATSLSQFDLQRNGGHDNTHAARNDPNIYEFDMESGGWRQIANMRTRRGSQWRLQIGDDKALLQKW